MLEQRWSIWRIYTTNDFAIERTPTRSSSKRQLHRVRALTKLPPWPSVTWRRERVSRCARCQAQKIHSTSVLQVSISVSECVSVCGCLCVWKFCCFLCQRTHTFQYVGPIRVNIPHTMAHKCKHVCRQYSKILYVLRTLVQDVRVLILLLGYLGILYLPFADSL